MFPKSSESLLSAFNWILFGVLELEKSVKIRLATEEEERRRLSGDDDLDAFRTKNKALRRVFPADAGVGALFCDRRWDARAKICSNCTARRSWNGNPPPSLP